MQNKARIETTAQMQKFIDELYNLTEQKEASEIKRKQWRLTYTTDGDVKIQSEIAAEPIYITTEDISVSGLGFVTKHQFHPGEKILIRIETDKGEIKIAGTVVHCTPTVGMLKVGVKFDLVDPENN